MMEESQDWIFVGEVKLSEDFLDHHGKWLIYGSKKFIENSAQKLLPIIGKCGIEQIKYSKSSAMKVPEGYSPEDHVLVVFCDDRDKTRVRKVLEKRVKGGEFFWKYNRETLREFIEKGGKVEEEILEKLRKYYPQL